MAGLAVHPAHRGDGLFRALLTAVIARCDAEGMAVSMLYPSHPALYRRYGYQVVARGESLIVPLVDLQRIPAVPHRRLVPVTAATEEMPARSSTVPSKGSASASARPRAMRPSRTATKRASGYLTEDILHLKDNSQPARITSSG